MQALLNRLKNKYEAIGQLGSVLESKLSTCFAHVCDNPALERGGVVVLDDHDDNAEVKENCAHLSELIHPSVHRSSKT